MNINIREVYVMLKAINEHDNMDDVYEYCKISKSKFYKDIHRYEESLNMKIMVNNKMKLTDKAYMLLNELVPISDQVKLLFSKYVCSIGVDECLFGNETLKDYYDPNHLFYYTNKDLISEFKTGALNEIVTSDVEHLNPNLYQIKELFSLHLYFVTPKNEPKKQVVAKNGCSIAKILSNNNILVDSLVNDHIQIVKLLLANQASSYLFTRKLLDNYDNLSIKKTNILVKYYKVRNIETP